MDLSVLRNRHLSDIMCTSILTSRVFFQSFASLCVIMISGCMFYEFSVLSLITTSEFWINVLCLLSTCIVYFSCRKSSPAQVQFNPEYPFYRGERVYVDGQSLEYVSPIQESCQYVLNQKTYHAVVLCDQVFNNGQLRIRSENGKTINVNASEVQFGPHVAGISSCNGRFSLKLQNSEVPAIGADCVFTEYTGRGKRRRNAVIAWHHINESEMVSIALNYGSDNVNHCMCRMSDIILPENVKRIGSMLYFTCRPSPPSMNSHKNGRVVKYYRADPLKDDLFNDTVSVVFGCESGHCRIPDVLASFCDVGAGPLSMMRPGAELKRFQASNVRSRGVEGLVNAVQEVDGLKRIAESLQSSGLVQVDKMNRTFCMHQLMQQAVGSELGWHLNCQRMQALLLVRCGLFGDETKIDVGMYGLLQEVAGAAVGAVGRVRSEGGWHVATWCSGMLFRLYEVARELHGAENVSPRRILTAAHGSLVADFLHVHIMKEGFRSGGRCLTLGNVVDTAPHMQNVIANYSYEDEEDISKSDMEENAELRNWRKFDPSFQAFKISYHTYQEDRVQSFDLLKCLRAHWGPKVQAALLIKLVHAHVMHDGCVSAEGHTMCMPLQAVAAAALIKDIMGLGSFVQRDFEQLLKCTRGMRVLNDGSSGSVVQVQGGTVDEGYHDEGVEIRIDDELRALRWRLHSLRGNAESDQNMMNEIRGVHAREGVGLLKWEFGVAMGAACHAAGVRCARSDNTDEAIATYKLALEMRLQTLGEQHPDTAATIYSMGTELFNSGNNDEAIIMAERALRIFEDTLTHHPSTAAAMSCIGSISFTTKQDKKAILFLEQALRMYERTTGRMHRDAAQVIYNMSKMYSNLGDSAKGEKLKLEALGIYMKTLGPGHVTTKEQLASLYLQPNSLSLSPIIC